MRDELTHSQLINLTVTLVACMLLSIEDLFPKHSRVKREIKKVEEAICNLARIHTEPVDDHMINAGVAAWNAAMQELQEKLLDNESGEGIIEPSELTE